VTPIQSRRSNAVDATTLVREVHIRHNALQGNTKPTQWRNRTVRISESSSSTLLPGNISQRDACVRVKRYVAAVTDGASNCPHVYRIIIASHIQLHILAVIGHGDS
jgi:hypothetical protein